MDYGAREWLPSAGMAAVGHRFDTYLLRIKLSRQPVPAWERRVDRRSSSVCQGLAAFRYGFSTCKTVQGLPSYYGGACASGSGTEDGMVLQWKEKSSPADNFHIGNETKRDKQLTPYFARS